MFGAAGPCRRLEYVDAPSVARRLRNVRAAKKRRAAVFFAGSIALQFRLRLRRVRFGRVDALAMSLVPHTPRKQRRSANEKQEKDKTLAYSSKTRQLCDCIYKSLFSSRSTATSEPEALLCDTCEPPDQRAPVAELVVRDDAIVIVEFGHHGRVRREHGIRIVLRKGTREAVVAGGIDAGRAPPRHNQIVLGLADTADHFLADELEQDDIERFGRVWVFAGDESARIQERFFVGDRNFSRAGSPIVGS